MIRKIIWRLLTILFYVFRIFPIKQNKVVFSSYSGKGYGGNCKYIAEGLMNQKEMKYDLVWLCSDKEAVFPTPIRVVPWLSIRSIYELCTARVWIDNKRKYSFVRKRKQQYYIQTWHGIAVKKEEKDVESSLPEIYIAGAKNDSKMADLFLAAGEFDARLIRNSFWYSGEILKCGYPRDDILYRNDPNEKEQIRKRLNIPEQTKIVLYAPTFRKAQNGEELKLYDIGWYSLLNAFNERFGGNWTGMVRLHPNISEYGSKLNLSENIINVTNYPDMQELLLIADCVITDYSSAIVEFAMTGKMGFIFAVDIADYMKDRGFYFSLDEMPFPVAESKEELISNILQFDFETYEKENTEFYKYKYGMYKDGQASKIVADRVLKIVKSANQDSKRQGI